MSDMLRRHWKKRWLPTHVLWKLPYGILLDMWVSWGKLVSRHTIDIFSWYLWKYCLWFFQCLRFWFWNRRRRYSSSLDNTSFFNPDFDFTNSGDIFDCGHHYNHSFHLRVLMFQKFIWKIRVYNQRHISFLFYSCSYIYFDIGFEYSHISNFHSFDNWTGLYNFNHIF